MTEIRIDPMLERIRKLLDKAEANTTPQEAEALRERAFALASKYEIDLALARESGKRPQDKVVNRIFDVGKPFNQQITLAYHLYVNSGCNAIQLTGFKGRVHVFGFQSDMDRADMLWTSLIVQATRESVRGYQAYLDNFKPTTCDNCGGSRFGQYEMDPEWGRCQTCKTDIMWHLVCFKPDRRPTWYRSFWQGWVTALVPRLEALRKEAKDEAETAPGGSGTEIALRSRDLAVKEAFSRAYPSIKQRRPNRRSKGSGFDNGHEAGKRADLGGGKLGRTTRELER